MKTVAISYGWAEGKRVGKHLRRELIKHGFKVVNKLEQADIIIAHSGGCFLLPQNTKAELILLVGLPYWPGKHPVRSLPRKLRQELKNLAWARKTFFNTYYMTTRPARWLRMQRAWRRNALPLHETAAILAVRNEQDHFVHPSGIATLAEEKGWELKTILGDHDDLWANPEPYAKLIKQRYGLLVKAD